MLARWDTLDLVPTLGVEVSGAVGDLDLSLEGLPSDLDPAVDAGPWQGSRRRAFRERVAVRDPGRLPRLDLEANPLLLPVVPPRCQLLEGSGAILAGLPLEKGLGRSIGEEVPE